jgi:TolA-binding protein
MNFKIKSSLLIISTLLLGACADQYQLATRSDVKDSREQLKKQVELLQKKIDSTNSAQETTNRRIQADLRLILDYQSRSTEKLNARLEENQYKLEQISTTSQKILNKKVVIEKKVVTDTQDTTTKVKTTVDLELEKLYNTAKNDFNSENYKDAYNGFKDVYEKNPKSELGENAMYWMAVCFDRTGQLDNAKLVFGRLLEEFPKGSKQCSALFQLGLLNKKLNKEDDSKKALKQLTSNKSCETSNEFGRAQDLLSENSK